MRAGSLPAFVHKRLAWARLVAGCCAAAVSATFGTVSYFGLYRYAPLPEQHTVLFPSKSWEFSVVLMGRGMYVPPPPLRMHGLV